MPGGWCGLILTALVVYLIANLVLSFFNEGDEPTISYTEFSKQVDDGNVTKIYSKGDAIQGQLKNAQDNPEGDGKYTKFKTQRPSFADDQLWENLDKHNVTVTAVAGRPAAQLPVQPADLAGPDAAAGRPVDLHRPADAAAGLGGAGGMLGRKAPPEAGRTAARRPAHDVRGRGRNRRGRGRAQRRRGLPQEPRRVPQDGRQDARGRAAGGPARHRQDAARAGGRGGGGGAVLLGLGLGVHRDDRGRRRLARARTVRRGPQGGPLHHLHRRDRHHRAGAGRRLRHGRPRRARADPEPDPHRDGRLLRLRGRDRHRGDEPRGRPGPGADPPGPLRPGRQRLAARPRRPRGDPGDPHPGDPARARTSTWPRWPVRRRA